MEIWKDIKDYEGYYKFSNYGRAKSVKRKIPNGGDRIGYRTMKSKILSYGKDSYGYMTVVFYKKGKGRTDRMHRLVWNYFNGSIPKDKVIDHIDGNPSNNNIKNLQLLTHRENITKGTVKKRSKWSLLPNVSYSLDRKKYFGRLQVNGKSIITGLFDNENDAYKSVIDYMIKNDINRT